jgi:predicted transcriptional regulator
MPDAPLSSREIIIRDKTNPRALINLVPEAVQNAIERLPEEYTNKSEPELLTLFQGRKYAPDPLVYRLRSMFWKEYDRAQCNLTKMNMAHVYMGICSKDYFYVVLQNKEKVSMIICPPVDYMLAAEEALIYGIEQLRDILQLKHTTISGAIDQKAAQVKVEIVKLLDTRVKGAVVQTTKNLNVNVNAQAPKDQGAVKTEDVDKRIKELEDSLSQLSSSATIKKETNIIDAEVVSDDSSAGKR